MTRNMNLTPPEIDLDYHGEVIVFDLDDTLYPERDYMMSGFKAVAESVLAFPDCSGNLSTHSVVSLMAEAYDRGGNAMDALADRLSLSDDLREAAIKDWVALYRSHEPRLTLADDVEQTLSALCARGIVLALITDGRSVAQRAKIEALGLNRYFSPDNIYISEERGAGKESMEPFAYVVHRYPEAAGFRYVADNPAKDFLFPNLMGWRTVCLLDTGTNIHSQKVAVASEYEPQATINSLTELLKL